jgi:DHA1 family bicyclomycin/chloramphenicol resistance-like MFS transporter
MDNGGLSTQQFGLLFGLNGLFMSLSCLYFARYAMRKGALATIWISLLFIGGGGLGLITQSYRTDVLTFMIPIFFMSTGFGGLLGPATGLAMQPFTQSIGQAASLSNAAQFFVSGIISTLIPYVPYPPRLSLGFLALVVTTGAGFICWYLITRFGAATLEGDGNEELDALKAVNTP